MGAWFNTIRKVWTRSLLRECRTWVSWLKFWEAFQGYNSEKFKGDFRAAVNTSLLAVPQGIVHALLAGLSIEYGLRAAAVAMLAATFFTKSCFSTPSPTNATAITLGSAFGAMGIMEMSQRAEQIPILVVLVGIFLVIGAMLGVARVAQYISHTVLLSYVMVAVMLMVAGQLRRILGLQIPEELYRKAGSFVEKVILAAQHLDTVHWSTFGIALLTFALFAFLQRNFRKLPNVLLSLAIVAVIVVGLDWLAKGGYLAAWLWEANSIVTLPPIQLAPEMVRMDFFKLDSIGPIAHIALALAMLCLLENVSIGKNLAARAGKHFETHRDTFSLGMSNIASGLSSGMPISGSLLRSKVTYDSGASTPLTFLMGSFFVLISSFLIRPIIHYVPEAAVGSIIMAIGISIVNRQAISRAVRATPDDAIVFCVTLIVGLLMPLYVAVFIGTGMSVLLFLRKVGSPELVEYGFNKGGVLAELGQSKRSLPEVSILHLEGELFFGAAEIFQEQMRRVGKDPNLKVIIVKMRNARHLDATAAIAIDELLHFMKDNKRALIFSECKKDTIRLFKNTGLLKRIGRGYVFPDRASNPTYSTAQALRKARVLIGSGPADVKIYIRGETKGDKKSDNEAEAAH